MSTHVFAYGTLINERIWLSVIKKRYKTAQGVLKGYKCGIIENEVYPGIIECDDCKVDGIIYYDLSTEDIEKLDNYETDFYYRTKLPVLCIDKIIYCETYVMKDEFAHMIGDIWNYNLFIDNHLDDFLLEIQ